MRYEVVCCLALKDSVARHHIKPLARHPLISRIWIVRHRGLDDGDIPNASYVYVSTKFKLLRFVQMAYFCFQLGRRVQVRAFVSFNPFPYGLFSYLAARLNRKAIHFGFVGSDWNLRCKRWWGRSALPLLRSGDFVTAMSGTMQQEMIERGFDPDRLAILPQSTDLERFPISDPRQASYSCIFLGSLIGLKNVEVIIRAFHELRESHPHASLCILGDGPLGPTLRRLAVQLGISERVEFAGFVNDVQPYLAKSKIIVIASSAEGFPSSLVEGICSGLVPICTPVGGIPEILIDSRNGFLFPQGDWATLADRIGRLLDDTKLYNRMRAEVLKLRPTFEHESTTSAWNTWLTTLEE